MASPNTIFARDADVISLTEVIRNTRRAPEAQAGLGLKLLPRLIDSLLNHYRPTYFESIDAFVVVDPLPFTGEDYVLEDALEETRDFCSLLDGKSLSRAMLEDRIYDGSIAGIKSGSKSVEIARAAPMTLEQFRKVHAESRQRAVDFTLSQFEERNERMYHSNWILDFLNKISSGSAKTDLRHEFYKHMQHMPLLLDTSIHVKRLYTYDYPHYFSAPEENRGRGSKEGKMITKMEVKLEPRAIVDVTTGNINFPGISMPGYSYNVSDFHETTGVPTDCSRDIYMFITSGISNYGRGNSSVALYLSMPEKVRTGEKYSAMAHFWRPDHVMDTIDFSNPTTVKKTDFSVPIVLYRK